MKDEPNKIEEPMAPKIIAVVKEITCFGIFLINELWKYFLIDVLNIKKWIRITNKIKTAEEVVIEDNKFFKLYLTENGIINAKDEIIQIAKTIVFCLFICPKMNEIKTVRESTRKI